jgi:hypothetical protein
MERLLICGDSFSADWTVKYSVVGWPNMLTQDYDVINLSQAGCSEYKIYQQLTSVDLNLFDRIIIAHTSPYRIYVEHHPIHNQDPLHGNSDLIYADLVFHKDTHPELKSPIDFFEKYFSLEYAEFTHRLICQEINNLVIDLPAIHMINFEGQYPFPNAIDFTLLFKTNRGTINHYDKKTNTIIYNKLKLLLQDV